MLFSYFEYTGNDFDADMKKMADDSMTQRWWKETYPCQLPLPDAAAKNRVWSGMEEVFYEEQWLQKILGVGKEMIFYTSLN